MAGGAVAALAHPPFGLWPGVFGFGLLLHTLDQVPPEQRWRAGFARGWAAGFGYFLICTWWIVEAFFVDAVVHAWQAPFAIALLAGGVSLFWAGAGLAYTLIAPRGAHRVLVFAAVLSGFEWLRGHLLTGFPWDLPGESWRAGSAPSQAAALIGAYGLSFVTIAIGSSLAVLSPADRPRTRFMTLAVAAVALMGLWSFGALRLAGTHEPETTLRLRLVQPNLGEEAAWTQASFQARYARFLQLTATPAPRRPDVVIWPEGAIPASFNDLLAPGTWTEAALEQVLRPGQILLSGGYRVDAQRGRRVYYNSLLALRRTGEGLKQIGLYDKYRLVPFGEYLPLEPLFAKLGVSNLMQAGESFTPGPVPAPISPAGLPRVQPLICYESLYPGFTSDTGGRAAWIVNVSDDAWFGRTSGPLQHLNLASYRAIEEGLPLIRSTPTGVSAVVDGYGRLRASLRLGAAGVLDANLPAPLPPTPYARVRDGPFYALVFGGLLLAAVGRRRRPRRDAPAGVAHARLEGHSSRKQAEF